MKARCTSCSCLSRRVRLGINLVTPSQQFMVLNSVRTTIFLTFSILSMTGMCRMSPVPVIATLGNSRVYSSPSDYSSMTPKVKWVANEGFIFETLLRVPDINPDNIHVRAGRSFHNTKYRGQCDVLKKRRARESLCHLDRSNRKREVGIPVENA